MIWQVLFSHVNSSQFTGLMERHGLTQEQACGLLARFGDDRLKLDKAAIRLTLPEAQRF
jgi:hypothetical protein